MISDRHWWPWNVCQYDIKHFHSKVPRRQTPFGLRQGITTFSGALGSRKQTDLWSPWHWIRKAKRSAGAGSSLCRLIWVGLGVLVPASDPDRHSLKLFGIAPNLSQKTCVRVKCVQMRENGFYGMESHLFRWSWARRINLVIIQRILALFR
jgi:hypothetical protein